MRECKSRGLSTPGSFLFGGKFPLDMNFLLCYSVGMSHHTVMFFPVFGTLVVWLGAWTTIMVKIGDSKRGI